MTTSSRLDLHRSAPSATPTHLEVRSYDPFVRKGVEVSDVSYSLKLTPEAEADDLKGLDDLFDCEWLNQITSLSIVVRDLEFGPDVSTGVLRLIQALPILQAITVCMVGIPDPQHVSSMIELHESCKRHGPQITLDFLLNTQADACAALAQMSSPLSLVLETSHTLRTKGMDVRWLIPLVPNLIYRLEALFSLARDECLEPVLIPTERLGSILELPEKDLSPDERLFAWDFITYRLLDEEKQLLPPKYVDYYRALQKTLSDARHRTSSRDQTVAVLHAANGGSGVRWDLHFELRPSFELAISEAASNTGKLAPENRFNSTAAQAAAAAGVLFDGLRAVLQWTITQGTAPLRRRKRAAPNDQFIDVMIIGAYGGEHIGDAAILGGVLNRIHHRYGTTRAILMSQRPAHTHHLVRMLDVPVKVKVETYEHSRVRECLPKVDAVVFAGGPLTDLPKQLVRHLYTVSLARRQDKPFIVEGIGAGPFVRWPSKWVGRQLVNKAMRISVRTSDDRKQDLVRGLNPEVGCDPAFDYLETRSAELTRVPESDQCWIEKLLQGTAGRILVGVNLRPIRHLYTVNTSGQNVVQYTRFIESRFEQRFAEGLRQFDRASAGKPCFVFFPMNAIQFGLSDLRSAYHIKRLLGNDVEFRVWESDASLEGVVALLRRLDIVISMRFHATIFALAQGRPVIGIDYRIGARDKVAALLSDVGRSSNCSRIDEMSADWLFERLCILSGLLQSSETRGE